MDGFNNYSIIDDDDPIANTKANNVIKLSEISKNCMKIKVPTNDTGTAIGDYCRPPISQEKKYN
jgi:hypothetical protein